MKFMKTMLTVQDIAAKQLISAIWMYAYNYDEVSVHTIAGAAFELYTTRLKYFDFESSINAHVRPEKHKEFKALWNKPYNIFKHGEWDYNKVEEYEYDEDLVEILLYIACEANLAGPEDYRLSAAQIYRLHFILKNPELVDKATYENLFKPIINPKTFNESEIQNRKVLQLLLKAQEEQGTRFINGTQTPYRSPKS